MERSERMERPVADAGAARPAHKELHPEHRSEWLSAPPPQPRHVAWQPAPQTFHAGLTLDAMAERLRRASPPEAGAAETGPCQVWPSPTRDGLDVSSAAVDALRNEVASLRERLAGVAPRRAVEEMDRAVTLLHRRVETLHEDGQSQQREERRVLSHELGALRRSLDALRAPGRQEALSAAIEALAGKIDRMAGAAVDAAEIARLQSQGAELRALLTRALSADGLQALAGRIAACAEEVTRAGDDSARRVSAAAGLLERNAQALLAGTERLEQHLTARDDRRDAGAAAPGLQREVSALHARLETLGGQMAAQADTWSPEARADLGARLDAILKAVERRAAAPAIGATALAEVERHLATLAERFRDAQERLGRLDAIEAALRTITDELRAGRTETAATTAEAVRHVALKLSGDAGAPAVLGLKRGLAALEARQEDLERRAETLLADAYPDDGFAGWADADNDDLHAAAEAAGPAAADGHGLTPDPDRDSFFHASEADGRRDDRPMPVAAADADIDDAALPSWEMPRRALEEESWADLARIAGNHATPPAGEPLCGPHFARVVRQVEDEEPEAARDAARNGVKDPAGPGRRRGVWPAAERDVRPRLDKRVSRKRPSQHRSALIALFAGAAMVLATTAAGLAWNNGTALTSAFSRIATGPAPTAGLPAPVGSAALQAAATAGDAAAAFEVGSRYADGHGVAADMSAAVKWLGYALSQGMVPAAYRLGGLYESVAADYAEATRFYEWAATQGHVKAMHNLGVLYSRGQVPGAASAGAPDWARAVSWFEQAAARGHSDSQYNLGVIHARGLAGPVNDEAAWKWFTLAAAQGDAESALKRDAVAQRMNADAVARAGKAVDNFAPQPVNAAVNVVAERPEWQVAAADDKVAARLTNAREVLAANTPAR